MTKYLLVHRFVYEIKDQCYCPRLCHIPVEIDKAISSSTRLSTGFFQSRWEGPHHLSLARVPLDVPGEVAQLPDRVARTDVAVIATSEERGDYMPSCRQALGETIRAQLRPAPLQILSVGARTGFAQCTVKRMRGGSCGTAPGAFLGCWPWRRNLLTGSVQIVLAAVEPDDCAAERLLAPATATKGRRWPWNECVLTFGQAKALVMSWATSSFECMLLSLVGSSAWQARLGLVLIVIRSMCIGRQRRRGDAAGNYFGAAHGLVLSAMQRESQ